MKIQENKTNTTKREQRQESKKELIEKILKSVYEDGKSLKDIASELGYTNGDSVGKILKRAGYKRTSKGYVLHSDEKDNKKSNDESQVLDTNDILNTLKTISERLDKLEHKDKEGILVSNEEMKYKATSIRVDESILQAFDELCDKYTNVSKSYLTSIALRDFVEKYGNIKKTR